MTAIEVLVASLESTKGLLAWYIADLSDVELLIRPTEGANHLAWQLGHIIESEQNLVRGQLPNVRYPALPAGFAKAHSKETATSDNAAGFAKKADYMELFNATRNVTIETVRSLSVADLERGTVGEVSNYAAKMMNLFLLLSEHTLMHAGQFSVVRRKLGKPVLF
jgi:hypothetical protein